MCAGISRFVCLGDVVSADVCQRTFCRLVGVYGPIFTFFARPAEKVSLFTNTPRLKNYREEAKAPKLLHNFGGSPVTWIVTLLLIHSVRLLLGLSTSSLVGKGRLLYLQDTKLLRVTIVLKLCTYEALMYIHVHSQHSCRQNNRKIPETCDEFNTK